METQKTLNSKNNLGREHSWNYQVPWLQTILQSYSNQDSVVLTQKQKYKSVGQDRNPWDKPIHLWSSRINSVQLLSHVWLFAAPWTTAHQASLSITNSQSLPKLMSIESVIPSNHLILHCPLLILCCPLLILPSIFPSIRVFSNESALRIGWPKHWSFSFSEYSGLISFRIDWFDLAVQGTLKSLL